MSESYIEIELNQQPIELYKLLKIANLVSGGGEAKVVISEGYVLLNGEVEYRKRKKIYHEDVIEFNGEIIQLIINNAQIYDGQAQETEDDCNPEFKEQPVEILKHDKKTKEPKPQRANKNISNDKSTASAKSIDSHLNDVPKKRRPISF